MTPGEFIEMLVQRNTKNDTVDIINIAKELNIGIYVKDDGSITNLASLSRSAKGDLRIILNKTNDNRHNYTLIALLIAELMLHPEKADRGISFDVFRLRDVRENRFSQTMMLATRLAIPEKIISRLDEFDFDISDYAQRSKFMPEFIKSAVKEKSLSFLVKNDMTGVLNLSK